MDTSGLDLSAWLTLVGVVVIFFVVPGTYLEVDRRRRLRRTRARAERVGR
ncbi:MAG TPA: hypothetical protein VHC43_16510 [Mycobacteriales bacterium]|nr:hypothetical protein [Mycobacteriales bacterium]